MPKNQLKPGSVQEPLALLYRNGDPAISGNVAFPRFTDICLTKDSQDICDAVFDEATRFDHPIRSEKECQDYIALHSMVDEVLHRIRTLAKTDREPFTKILQQISAALEPIQTKLVTISSGLNNQITKWRAQVLEGQRREQQRLEAEAEEKRNEAKYTDDPKKSRQATVQAKQLEKAAKEAAPKAEKGIDTEEYWEGEIINRIQAGKLSAKIVSMEVDQIELNKEIKAMQRAGTNITPNIFPGLELTRKTRVRFHR